jgi:hypothetical protein
MESSGSYVHTASEATRAVYAALVEAEEAERLDAETLTLSTRAGKSASGSLTPVVGGTLPRMRR